MTNERFEISDGSLRAAVAFAERSGTAQLVISRGDQMLVDERYTEDPVDVYAVQKGLVSVLFGIAEDSGLLRFDDPVSDHLGTGWTELSSEVERKVTIRAVLEMTTGMDNELSPLGVVGRSWRYNNVAYNYLKRVLELVTERSLGEVSQAWLLDPLGMESTSWVDRSVLLPDGRPISGLLSTAADMARFGVLVLAGGRGLAPSAYLERLGRPGSVENPAWGLCWWNNDQAIYRLPRRESEPKQGPLTPEAPADLIAARGAMENYLFVVPSLNLVVARTAAAVPRGERPMRFDRPFWKALSGQ